jgi:hypothetical protein
MTIPTVAGAARATHKQLPNGKGMQPVTEADEDTRGSASLMGIEPDGTPMLIDQHA